MAFRPEVGLPLLNACPGTPVPSIDRAVFENNRKETGETFLSIKLDFAVGVTELVAFIPKSRDDDNDPIED